MFNSWVSAENIAWWRTVGSRAFILEPRLKIGKGKKKEGKEKERKEKNLETSNEKTHKFIIGHFQVVAVGWEMDLRESGSSVTPNEAEANVLYSILLVLLLTH